MDYEKAYKKALERARNVHKYSSDIAEIKRMEYIFSELAESEDDKIRNFISNELTCLRATTGKGSNRYEELTNAIAWLKKQGEQKPIDWSKHIKYNPNSPSIIKESDWSEEDESMYTRTLGILGKCYMGQLPTKVEEELKWFKSIRDRVIPQQKSAWSEEDEKMYRGLMAVCDVWSTASSFYPKENEDVERLKNWLKSLKTRITWKPSDEQIVVLELASKYERVFTPKQIDILIGLKEQLKKLKG